MATGNKNKVKFNLKNVHWAKIMIADDGTISFGTVYPWPGAVSMTLDAQGEPTVFHADGIRYYVVNNNNGYSGDYESALVPLQFRKDILGEFEDNNGVVVENADAPSVPFALMFEFDGDKKGIRHIVYNNTATRPSIGSKTKEDTTEVQTETLTITSSPLYIPALEKSVTKAKTDENTSATTYNNWYAAPYLPNSVASSVSISGPSSVAAGSTITLVATTVPAEGEVVWSSNDTDVLTVTSGGVVSGVAAGSAVVMATLSTDSSVFATKVITVTAS